MVTSPHTIHPLCIFGKGSQFFQKPMANKPKQTLKGPAKHLEEEELRGNPQDSIMLHEG